MVSGPEVIVMNRPFFNADQKISEKHIHLKEPKNRSAAWAGIQKDKGKLEDHVYTLEDLLLILHTVDFSLPQNRSTFYSIVKNYAKEIAKNDRTEEGFQQLIFKLPPEYHEEFVSSVAESLPFFPGSVLFVLAKKNAALAEKVLSDRKLAVKLDKYAGGKGIPYFRAELAQSYSCNLPIYDKAIEEEYVVSLGEVREAGKGKETVEDVEKMFDLSGLNFHQKDLLKRFYQDLKALCGARNSKEIKLELVKIKLGYLETFEKLKKEFLDFTDERDFKFTKENLASKQANFSLQGVSGTAPECVLVKQLLGVVEAMEDKKINKEDVAQFKKEKESLAAEVEEKNKEIDKKLPELIRILKDVHLNDSRALDRFFDPSFEGSTEEQRWKNLSYLTHSEKYSSLIDTKHIRFFIKMIQAAAVNQDHQHQEKVKKSFSSIIKYLVSNKHLKDNFRRYLGGGDDLQEDINAEFQGNSANPTGFSIEERKTFFAYSPNVISKENNEGTADENIFRQHPEITREIFQRHPEEFKEAVVAAHLNTEAKLRFLSANRHWLTWRHVATLNEEMAQKEDKENWVKILGKNLYSDDFDKSKNLFERTRKEVVKILDPEVVYDLSTDAEAGVIKPEDKSFLALIFKQNPEVTRSILIQKNWFNKDINYARLILEQNSHFDLDDFSSLDLAKPEDKIIYGAIYICNAIYNSNRWTESRRTAEVIQAVIEELIEPEKHSEKRKSGQAVFHGLKPQQKEAILYYIFNNNALREKLKSEYVPSWAILENSKKEKVNKENKLSALNQKYLTPVVMSDGWEETTSIPLVRTNPSHSISTTSSNVEERRPAPFSTADKVKSLDKQATLSAEEISNPAQAILFAQNYSSLPARERFRRESTSANYLIDGLTSETIKNQSVIQSLIVALAGKNQLTIGQLQKLLELNIKDEKINNELLRLTPFGDNFKIFVKDNFKLIQSNNLYFSKIKEKLGNNITDSQQAIKYAQDYFLLTESIFADNNEKANFLIKGITAADTTNIDIINCLENACKGKIGRKDYLSVDQLQKILALNLNDKPVIDDLVKLTNPQDIFALIKALPLGVIKSNSKYFKALQFDVFSIKASYEQEVDSVDEEGASAKLIELSYVKFFENGKVLNDERTIADLKANKELLLAFVDKDVDLTDSNTKKLFMSLFDNTSSLKSEDYIKLLKKKNSDLIYKIQEVCVLQTQVTIRILNSNLSDKEVVSAIKDAVPALFVTSRTTLNDHAVLKIFESSQFSSNFERYPDLIVKLLFVDASKALCGKLLTDHIDWSEANLTKVQVEQLLKFEFKKEVFSNFKLVQKLERTDFADDEMEFMLENAQAFMGDELIKNKLKDQVEMHWLGDNFKGKKDQIKKLFLAPDVRKALLAAILVDHIKSLCDDDHEIIKILFNERKDSSVKFNQVIQKLSFAKKEVSLEVIKLEDTEIQNLKINKEKLSQLLGQKEPSITKWVFDKREKFQDAFNQLLPELKLDNIDTANRVIAIKDAKLTKDQLLQLLKLSDKAITDWVFVNKVDLLFDEKETKELFGINPFFAAKVITEELISAEDFFDLVLDEKKKEFVERLLDTKEPQLIKYIQKIYKHTENHVNKVKLSDLLKNYEPTVKIKEEKQTSPRVSLDPLTLRSNGLTCSKLLELAKDERDLSKRLEHYIDAYIHQTVGHKNYEDSKEGVNRKIGLGWMLIETCFKHKMYALLIRLLEHKQDVLDSDPSIFNTPKKVEYRQKIQEKFLTEFRKVDVKEAFNLLNNPRFKFISIDFFDSIQDHLSNIGVWNNLDITFFDEQNRNTFGKYIANLGKKKDILEYVLGKTANAFQILKSNPELLEWVAGIAKEKTKSLIEEALKSKELSVVEFLRSPTLTSSFEKEELLKIAKDAKDDDTDSVESSSVKRTHSLQILRTYSHLAKANEINKVVSPVPAKKTPTRIDEIGAPPPPAFALPPSSVGFVPPPPPPLVGSRVPPPPPRRETTSAPALAASGDMSALLGSIQKGITLKKTETVDKAKPVIAKDNGGERSPTPPFTAPPAMAASAPKVVVPELPAILKEAKDAKNNPIIKSFVLQEIFKEVKTRSEEIDKEILTALTNLITGAVDQKGIDTERNDDFWKRNKEKFEGLCNLNIPFKNLCNLMGWNDLKADKVIGLYLKLMPLRKNYLAANPASVSDSVSATSKPAVAETRPKEKENISPRLTESKPLTSSIPEKDIPPSAPSKLSSTDAVITRRLSDSSISSAVAKPIEKPLEVVEKSITAALAPPPPPPSLTTGSSESLKADGPPAPLLSRKGSTGSDATILSKLGAGGPPIAPPPPPKLNPITSELKPSPYKPGDVPANPLLKEKAKSDPGALLNSINNIIPKVIGLDKIVIKNILDARKEGVARDEIIECLHKLVTPNLEMAKINEHLKSLNNFLNPEMNGKFDIQIRDAQARISKVGEGVDFVVATNKARVTEEIGDLGSVLAKALIARRADLVEKNPADSKQGSDEWSDDEDDDKTSSTPRYG
jgi:hypothetical protein